MQQTQVKLAGIWIALMLVYLLGDVLRIFSGNFVPGEIEGQVISEAMWLAIAVLMLTPILMVLVNLLVTGRAVIRWANLAAAGFWLLFNGFGLPSYPNPFDAFLIVVGLGFNLLTLWYAWGWKQQDSKTSLKSVEFGKVSQ